MNTDRTQFVSEILISCKVDSVRQIKPGMINGDQTRIMQKHMSSAASKLLLDATSIADETGEPYVAEGDIFYSSGLQSLPNEDATIIVLIYEHHDREIEITEDQLVVSPSATALARKRARDKKQIAEEKLAHGK